MQFKTALTIVTNFQTSFNELPVRIINKFLHYIIIIFKIYRVTPHSFTHAHYIVLIEQTSIYFFQ